jgi:CubicO group peptidase (beta-lactamase class C family)
MLAVSNDGRIETKKPGMMKLKITVLLILLSKLSFGQKNDTRLNGLDTEIANLVKAYNAVGLSIAVIENNKTIYSKGFGFRDLETKLPITPSTIFPIGSTTKAFTASLLGILEDQHRLSIKDKPSLYIPKLQFYNDKMDNLITIGDLLCHKSGIGGVDGTYIFFPAVKRIDLMPRLKYLKQNGPVNESWIYSNFGYVIAGTIVEQVTNQSWDKNIQDEIFTPLHMNSSSTSISEMLKSGNYASGYGINNKETKKLIFEELNNDKPVGGINSTVTDLTNWMTTWLNNGTFNGKEILSENYIREATSIKAIDNGLPPETSDPNVYTFGYGYGWKINSNKGHYKVNHGGNVSGFSSQMVLYPTDSLGIVVLVNQHNSLLPFIVADLVTNRMLKLQRTAWSSYPVKVAEVNLVSREIKGLNTTEKLTHSFPAYCGKYSNAGYGTFEIVNENENLFAVFPGFKFRLEHRFYDIFVLKATREIAQNMNPEFFLNFGLDNEGNVSTVKINLQDDPVEFVRQAKE